MVELGNLFSVIDMIGFCEVSSFLLKRCDGVRELWYNFDSGTNIRSELNFVCRKEWMVG